MKTLFKINTHSFVDLITNSSSELFVCGNEKSIKIIEEAIEELWDKSKGFEYFASILNDSYWSRNPKEDYNMFMEEVKNLNLWKDVLEKPMSVPYGIDISKILTHEEIKSMDLSYPYDSGKYDKARQKVLDYYKSIVDYNPLLATCIDYNIAIRKNDIVIESKGSNTVPYAFQEILEKELLFKRYHLG